MTKLFWHKKNQLQESFSCLLPSQVIFLEELPGEFPSSPTAMEVLYRIKVSPPYFPTVF